MTQHITEEIPELQEETLKDVLRAAQRAGKAIDRDPYDLVQTIAETFNKDLTVTPYVTAGGTEGFLWGPIAQYADNCTPGEYVFCEGNRAPFKECTPTRESRRLEFRVLHAAKKVAKSGVYMTPREAWNMAECGPNRLPRRLIIRLVRVAGSETFAEFAKEEMS